MKRKYEVDEKVIKVVMEYLAGELSTRQAGRELGISHQAILNLTTSLLREWYQEGKVKIFPNGETK